MSDNWKKVEKIFHAALDLPLDERTRFLQNECAGDSELLAEIESLLENHENPAEFLDENAFDLGLGALHESEQSNLSGSTIGFYEVKEKIGAGGMGKVYKAFDTRLNRFVALKFLTESLKNDNSAKRRLVREAQAAAALEHPNICAVYGFEQTDEHHFIVMQYIEGKMLGEHFKDRRVGVTEFKSLARQILEGVAFAHLHDVIHRDLKPGNIMLTSDGQIKILDFGLAKILKDKVLGGASGDEASRYSQHGLIIGTVAYMSPEQLRGERLDFRSDIFSVGIVLRELMAGQNPFSRQSQAETIAAILAEQTFVSKEIAPEFPRSLREIVEKCLQKDREARFQSAAEMLVALDQADTKNGFASNNLLSRSFYVKTALAVIILFAAAAVFFFYNAAKSSKTLAVLPFSLENVPPEKEYLADSLTQSIIEKLSNLTKLKVKKDSVVAGYKGKSIAPVIAGKELNVDAVITGKLENRGNKLTLITNIIRTSDGFVIDTKETEIEESNLIERQEEISQFIIAKIRLNLTDDDVNKLAKRDTNNDEAKRLYFLGRYCLSRKAGDDVNNAVKYFTVAKELDPSYAKAWAGLADAYLASSAPGVQNALTPEEAVRNARSAAKKAVELDNTLSESYNSLGLISRNYDWNWQTAESYFRTAIFHDPEFIAPHINLIGVLNNQGRFDESLQEAQKAKEIDPLALEPDLEIAKIYYKKGEFDKMAAIVSVLLQKFPINNRINYIQIYQFLITERYDEAIDSLEKNYQSDKESEKIMASAPLGFALAKAGRTEEALDIIKNLDNFTKDNFVPSQEKAVIYVGLGDFDKAFENLDKSCAEKFSSLPAFVTDPLVDDIKSDPRFLKIRQCVNL